MAIDKHREPLESAPEGNAGAGRAFADRAARFLRPGNAPSGAAAWAALVADALRIGFRAPLMFGWLFFIYGLWLLCALAHAGRRRSLRPWRRRLLRLWGRGALRILGMRLDLAGEPPRPPFFLVANHTGYLDIVVVAATTGSVFIAKSEMAGWPLVGAMMRTSQQLFIRREDARDLNRAIALVHQVYEEEDGITVFAEGRCSDGSTVLPFRPGLFEAAARGGWPVHFAALSYRTADGEPTASDALAWWRWEPAAHMFARLLRVRRAVASVRFCAAPIPPNGRKALAAETHAGVVAVFEPLAPGVLPPLPAPPGLPRHLRNPGE